MWKTWRFWIVFMGIFSVLMTALTGCGNGKNQGNEPVWAIESEVLPVPFPQGAELKHLFMTHQGMRSGNYYILKTTDTGVWMKISNLSPDDWRMLEGEHGSVGDEPGVLGFADTVKDCERASLVLLDDDGPIRELEQLITETGALGWDGFRKRVAMPDVKDSGDRYMLYLELSDGTTVTVDSYNSRPAGYARLLSGVENMFQANSDYTRYRVTDFTSLACTDLYVGFRSTLGKGEWRMELHRANGQWGVVLNDPEGLFVEAGTEIAQYSQIGEELPFERFMEIFTNHGAEKWNGYEASDGGSNDRFEVWLRFEGRKEYVASGSLLPEGFEAFRKEFIEEIRDFYHEYKS